MITVALAKKAANLTLRKILPKADSAQANYPLTLSPEQLTFWQENGYLVLKGFFSPERIAEINNSVDQAWKTRHNPKNPLVIDILSGPLNGKRTYLRDAADETRKEVHKLNDLYLVSDKVRNLILDPSLVTALEDLLEGLPIVCNSLNFEFGSQQDYHYDTWYMPPPVLHKMAVSSICLEDTDPLAGPLQYYPGSHKIPPYFFKNGSLAVGGNEKEFGACNAYIAKEIAARGLKPTQFIGKTGDVFIWHSQLFHGGSPIEDRTRTRRSLVTHYWRKQDVETHTGWDIARFGKAQYYINRGHQKVA